MSTTPYLCWLAIITVWGCTPFHLQIAQKSQVAHQAMMKVNMSQMNQVTTVMSDNSHFSESETHATPSIDVRQFIVASTSDYEMSESVSTDIELWSSSDSKTSASSSPSSLCTSTSEYSQDPLPSFAQLLD